MYIILKILLMIPMVTSTMNNLQRFVDQKVTNLPPTAPAFLKDFAKKELDTCSLIILFNKAEHFGLVVSELYEEINNIILINMRNIKKKEVLEIKNQIKKNSLKSCLAYLVLFDSSAMKTVVSYGKQFWAGKTKILFLSMEYIKFEEMNTLFGNSIFNKTSQLIFANPHEKTGNFDLFGLKFYERKLRKSFSRISKWSKFNGISWKKSLYESLYNKKFDGHELTISTLPYLPFVIAEDNEGSGENGYRGMEIHLLKTLAHYADFTYKFVTPADKQWGKKLKNSSWTGMIGMVGREEADFAISDIAPSLLRMSYVDFTNTFLYDDSLLITPLGSPLPMWQGPIRPFNTSSWGSLIGAIFFIAGILQGLSFIPLFGGEVLWYRNYSNCLLVVIPPILARCSIPFKPKYLSWRILFMVWVICALVISTFYSSLLTSFLILPGYNEPIEDLDELVVSDIGWAKVDFGGLQNEMLETATHPTLKALGRGVQWRNDLNGILQDVMQGKIATWENAITTKLKVAMEFSDKNRQPLVHFTDYSLLKERISWPIQKDAPFKQRMQ